MQASTKTAVAVQGVAPPRPGNAGVLQTCYRCGKTGHHPDRCFYKSQRCRAYGKKEHIAKPCRNSKKGVQNTPKHNPGVDGFKPVAKRRPGGQSGHRAGYVEHELQQGGASGPEELVDLSHTRKAKQELFTLIRTVRGAPKLAIMLEPEVNGVTLPMELDTDASVSIISQKVWKETFDKPRLMKSDTLLKTYSGEKL